MLSAVHLHILSHPPRGNPPLLEYVDQLPEVSQQVDLGQMQSINLCFFFQAEDGIRDVAVTGVQTCALPISRRISRSRSGVVLSTHRSAARCIKSDVAGWAAIQSMRSSSSWCRSSNRPTTIASRSEERRVGKEGRSRWSPYH